MLASYAQKSEDVTLRDIGFAEQADLLDRVADRLGHPPPVIEAEDVRRDPREALTSLCAAIDLPFAEAMLSWLQASTLTMESGRHTGMAPSSPRRDLLRRRKQRRHCRGTCKR